jgi:hypothetical protein
MTSCPLILVHRATECKIEQNGASGVRYCAATKPNQPVQTMKKIVLILTLIAFALVSSVQVLEASPAKSKSAARAKAKPGKKAKKGKIGGKKRGGRRK